MKGAVTVCGKRIEVGQRVQIIDGPFASRFAIYKGKSRTKKKIVVIPFLGRARILLEPQAIRKVGP